MGKLSLTIFVGMTIFLSGCLLTTKQSNQTDGHLTQVVATTSAYQKEREEYVAAILNTSTWRVFVDEDNGVRFKYPAVFTHLERRKDFPVYHLKTKEGRFGLTLDFSYTKGYKSRSLCAKPGYNELNYYYCIQGNYTGVSYEATIKDGDNYQPYPLYSLEFDNPRTTATSTYKSISVLFYSTIDYEALEKFLDEQVSVNTESVLKAIGNSITDKTLGNIDIYFIDELIASFKL